MVYTSSHGQNEIDEAKKPILDSLRVILKTPGVHDTTFAKATVMLSELVYWETANDTGIINSCNRTIGFVDKKLPAYLNKKIKSSLLKSKALALNNRGNYLLGIRDEAGARAMFYASIQLYGQTNKSTKEFEPYYNLALYYGEKNQKDSALYYGRLGIRYCFDKVIKLRILGKIVFDSPYSWNIDEIRIEIGDTLEQYATDSILAVRVSQILQTLGYYFMSSGDYTNSISNYNRFHNLGLKFHYSRGYSAFGELYKRAGDIEMAKKYYYKNYFFIRDTSSLEFKNLSLASMEVELGNLIYDQYPDSARALMKSAKVHWQVARKENEHVGNWPIQLLYHSLAQHKLEEQNWEEAFLYRDSILTLENEYYNPNHGYSNDIAMKYYYALGELDSAELYAIRKLEGYKNYSSKYLYPLKSTAKFLTKIYSKKRNYERFYYYQNIVDSVEALLNDNENRLIISYHRQQQKELELQKQQAEKNHEAETRQRTLAAGGLLLFVLAGGLFGRLRYVRKTKRIIEKERDRSDNLLLNILPAEVAAELKDKGESEARDFDNVSVLFSDFQSFTETSEKLSAKELVTEINACFKRFDEITQQYGIEKIKTIGDAYMAAGGLHTPRTSEPKDVVKAALEMQQFMLARKAEREAQGQVAFNMRVGIHTGPVVAGIVGVKKFQYDIWGDTVNTASRMETNSQVGKVNISQATYELLKDDPQFVFEKREKIEVKGKGQLQMWFVSHA